MGGALARPAAERRLDELCELLRAMHGADRDDVLDRGCANPARSAVDFAKLQCIGWTLASEPSFAHIGIVFRYPPCHHGALPRSLLDRISASRSLHAPVPALGRRFELALAITRAVANIISVGWSKQPSSLNSVFDTRKRR